MDQSSKPNANEHKKAVRRLDEERQHLAWHESRLITQCSAPEETRRVIPPLRSFHEQLAKFASTSRRIPAWMASLFAAEQNPRKSPLSG